ncbi:hypothetical protein GH714_001997 [Hevea brasiliensis]|uniref:Uncharacterized protein n=1 Tax=Hevea brasiliensis TaxID=3981 RepID=A0A6A6L5S4_HEVBR|nr:hypothetical protein GH714_001997 [Hevea brasiliensis]
MEVSSFDASIDSLDSWNQLVLKDEEINQSRNQVYEDANATIAAVDASENPHMDLSAAGELESWLLDMEPCSLITMGASNIQLKHIQNPENFILWGRKYPRIRSEAPISESDKIIHIEDEGDAKVAQPRRSPAASMYPWIRGTSKFLQMKKKSDMAVGSKVYGNTDGFDCSSGDRVMAFRYMLAMDG